MQYSNAWNANNNCILTNIFISRYFTQQYRIGQSKRVSGADWDNRFIHDHAMTAQQKSEVKHFHELGHSLFGLRV